MTPVPRSIAIAAALVAGAATTAYAGLTDVGVVPDNEARRIGVFESLYGGEFSRNDVGFTNGQVTLQRVPDTEEGGLTPNAVIPRTPVSDQTFQSGYYSAKAVSRYSLNDQTFGYFAGDGFQTLFDVGGFGQDVSGEVSVVDLTSGPIAWGRAGGEGGLHSSIISENADNRDHMLTYEVVGAVEPDAESSYLLFWEDLTNDGTLTPGRTNNDFNDVVIQVSRLSASAAVVPLPPAALGTLLVLSPVLVKITKRQRAKMTRR